MDLAELRKLLDCGLGMALATRDASLRPEITEVMGCSLSADGRHIKVYIDEEDGKTALENVADNGLVAVTLARPTTYMAFQIKGRSATARPISEEERERSRIWAEKYSEELGLIGLHPDAIRALRYEASHTVEAEVVEVFTQTPGPDAGRRVGQP